jgi:3-isopropylmalate/(R)-2-methylmalate dehydratase small subunit
MTGVLRGRAAFVFTEEDFDVDQICGVDSILVQDLDQLVRAAMRSYDPEFASTIRRGDFLIGAGNFGYGHPHYQSMRAMRALGVAAVVAESFSPGYWRGEVSMGFPQFPCPGIVAAVERWDELEIDATAGVVRNLTQGRALTLQPIPEWDRRMIEAGGLVEFLRQNLAREASASKEVR